MKRFIDANELRLKVQRYLMPHVDEHGMVFVNDAERYFLKLIEDQPTADVEEVKHGYWVKVGKTKGGSNILQCSECGKVRKGVGKSTYCRDCGAKMDGGKKE